MPNVTRTIYNEVTFIIAKYNTLNSIKATELSRTRECHQPNNELGLLYHGPQAFRMIERLNIVFVMPDPVNIINMVFWKYLDF